MEVKHIIITGVVGLVAYTGIFATGAYAQKDKKVDPSSKDGNTDELVKKFKKLLDERVAVLEPEAVAIAERAKKNGGRFDINLDALKALVKKWSAETPPREVVADFERLLYQKVREGEKEAVRIYNKAVKDGGKLSVTYPEMRELVDKWKGKKVKAEDRTLKFEPELTFGKSKVISYTTKTVGQLMLTKATVNGVEGNFIIDTGCSHSLISSEFAKKLNVSGEIRKVEAIGTINNDQQQVVRINSLKVSDTEFTNFDMMIVPLAHFEGVFKKKIAGFIGSNLLSVSSYIIQFADQKIVLERPSKLDGAFEAPLSFIKGRPSFEMTINTRKKVKFVIDSGATESIMPKALYKGKTVKRSGGVEVDINQNRGSRMREYGLPHTMAVAGNKLKCIPLKLSSNNKPGLLGADFLRSYDIFVDTENKKIYFTKGSLR